MIVIAIALLLLAPVFMAYLTIAPLHELTRPRRGKAVILTIDLFALLILIQVALGIGLAVLGRTIDRGLWPILALISALIVVMWWGGVDALTQLGVRQASRRLLMHLAFLPGVCAVMISTCITAATFMALLDNRAEFRSQLEFFSIMLVSTIVGVWLLRSMSLWIARGGERF